MDELLFVAIGLGVACIILSISITSLTNRVSHLEYISKKHDEGIQDLYTRKANKKPSVEVTCSPDMSRDLVIAEMNGYISEYLSRKKQPL